MRKPAAPPRATTTSPLLYLTIARRARSSSSPGHRRALGLGRRCCTRLPRTCSKGSWTGSTTRSRPLILLNWIWKFSRNELID
ncbi:hypothetical protein LINPERPRIM_LOCUS30257 [Linum perenne]